MQSNAPFIVVLGTGGTIAGISTEPGSTTAYSAGQIGVELLVQAVPGLREVVSAAGVALQFEQVAQIDSKNMDAFVWQALAARAAHHLGRGDVRGVLVTHGTDTLEETAYLLHRLLGPRKPLVLTAAMRPASVASADGPVNMLDALRVAAMGHADGVTVVMAGAVWHPVGLRKLHTMRLDAFTAGDAGPIGRLDGGVWRAFRQPPPAVPLGIGRIGRPAVHWPWVEIVLNHAGADGRLVDALVAAGVEGLVVAGTGIGTRSDRLDCALARAVDAGVEVRLASRCALGPVPDDAGPGAMGDLGAPQARVELLLELLGRDSAKVNV